MKLICANATCRKEFEGKSCNHNQSLSFCKRECFEEYHASPEGRFESKTFADNPPAGGSKKVGMLGC
ncbi:MAG: hypothetical protein WC763_00375 [Candidatus Paceibacterota bacterium]